MSAVYRVLVLSPHASFFDLVVASLRESGIPAIPRRVETADGIRAEAVLGQCDALLLDAEWDVDLGEALAAAGEAMPPPGVIAVGHTYKSDWLLRLHRPGIHAVAAVSDLASLSVSIPSSIADARALSRASLSSFSAGERGFRKPLSELRQEVAGIIDRLRKIEEQMFRAALDRFQTRSLAGEVGCECARLGSISGRLRDLQSAADGTSAVPNVTPPRKSPASRATALGQTLTEGSAPRAGARHQAANNTDSRGGSSC